MPKYDARCFDCGNTYEEIRKALDSVSPCPECGGKGRTVWLSTPTVDRAKDPYDYLDGRIPSAKRIFSGPKVKSKTTV